MKVCIIAIAKNEDKYINEWINYHLSLGFDNIIVCDNDDELVLTGVVKDDRVIIEDWTKRRGFQWEAYRTTFKKYKSNYNWVLFIDIDEFLILENHDNVKDFLLSFDKNIQCIKLCWKTFSGGNDMDVVNENYNVISRFNEEINCRNDKLVKSFISTNISEKEAQTITQHSLMANVKSVDATGNKSNGSTINKIVHKIAWINHYPTKTIGEYVRQKYFRGGANNNDGRYRQLRYFFEYNTWTQEKEDYAKKLIAEYESTHNR